MSVRTPLGYVIDYCTNTHKNDAEEEHAVLAALEAPIPSEEESPSNVSRSSQSSVYDTVGCRDSRLKMEVKLIYRTPLITTIRVYEW